MSALATEFQLTSIELATPEVAETVGVETVPIAAWLTVTVVAEVEVAKKPLAEAFVAVTVHVPEAEKDSVPLETEHWAVPAFVTEYVTAPEPEPPLEVRVWLAPKVAVVELTLRALWLARA